MDVDGAHGERAATEHLIAAGHRRIAFLGWPEDSDVGEDRKAGWEQACQAAGLPTDGLCARLEDDLAQGREGCARLLEAADPPTAFVCVSDTIALGAWTEITARGLVPGLDVAVIGFDDSTAAAAVGPDQRGAATGRGGRRLPGRTGQAPLPRQRPGQARRQAPRAA